MGCRLAHIFLPWKAVVNRNKLLYTNDFIKVKMELFTFWEKPSKSAEKNNSQTEGTNVKITCKL
jgi:hypothetical protein